LIRRNFDFGLRKRAGYTVETPANETQSLALSEGVDLDRLPEHIAIIMDGNGRWAKSKGLQRLLGHREGYRSLRGALLAANELGVRYLTVYAFSVENWRRPQDEVAGLLRLIEQAAKDELRLMHQNNVRFQVTGRLHELPPSLQAALNDGIEATSRNTGITLTLAINYGGRAEITDAIQKIIASGAAPESIDEDTVSRFMYNPSHPDPDLMVRTAGEMRWSNFLIWQAAYAELFVCDVAWPDFKPHHLIQAVKAYQGRTRKFGAVVE
jgi:undecaprenyl diphosphate synthase